MTSNKKRIRLSEIIGPAFYETHKLIDMGVIDEAVEAGGRASLKSSYVGTELVLQLLKHPDCHALVTRQVGDTMRDSVYAQILWAIDKLGLTAKFKCTQSPLQCTYTPTGQRILFRGLDDPQKIKSIKLPFGYIGILWFEEADQIKGGEDAVRNVQQSALRGGEFGLTFISFNPPAASRNWANRYAREERNVTADKMLEGSSGYSDDAHSIVAGRMPNRGSWGASLSPGGVATIPSGYHNGGGQVTAVALKTVTITMATSYGDWVYTLPSGTLVGVSNIAASGESPEIASLTISGNTVRVTWSNNGVINRQITLIYY